MAAFEIDNAKREAAQLIADGVLTYDEIAARVGIVRATLWNWKKYPEFMALIAEHRAQFAEEVIGLRLADRMRRVKAQDDRWNRMRKVIEDRADAPEMAEAPGGTTGLLCRTLKKIGSGDSAETVEEFAVDTGLLDMLLKHEKQAAIELGQWSERREVAGSVSPIDIEIRMKATEQASVEIGQWCRQMKDELSILMDEPATLEPPGAKSSS